jgi:cellulose synthase (UDP-forming)
VQHYEVGRHEQSMFFEVVCPGKDHHNGVFWCGSAALLRREALVGVGGVCTETIAEDFHTTIKMHSAGWKTCYHDEVLVQGLAPMDMDGYLLQRDRWARGNLAVLSLPESPLRPCAGLSAYQRVSYFGSLFAYGAGAARLAMIGLLVVVLVGGVLPARMSVLSLAVFWAPWTLLAVVSANALSQGHLRMGESSHYTLVTAAVYTKALRCFPIAIEVQGHTQGRDRSGRPPFARPCPAREPARPGALRWARLAGTRAPRGCAGAVASCLGGDVRDGARDLGALQSCSLTAHRLP